MGHLNVKKSIYKILESSFDLWYYSGYLCNKIQKEMCLSVYIAYGLNILQVSASAYRHNNI